MSYTINLTNGTKLTDIVDGTVDQTSTDLTLLGKNSTNYGTFIDENFVHLLENFANTSQPNHPLAGQLWFDTSDNVLKIYNGSSFTPTGNTLVASSAPSGLTTGGLWINNSTGQIYFNDGASTILAGPLYTTLQGQSGFAVQDIIDTNAINHTVVMLYVAQSLLGIFSKTAFIPASSITGFTGSIQIGFNVSNYAGIEFNVPVSTATSLMAADSTLKTAESFLSSTDDSASSGTLSIQNSIPLVLGPSANVEFNIGSMLTQLKSNKTDQNIQITSLNSSGVSPAIFINANAQHLGIFTATPTATLDVNGDVVISGDLTVNGAVTTVNSTQVDIADKNILLGATVTPTNITANGGGIQIAGDTTKSLLWFSATTAWTSSENFNLTAGNAYKINGFDVLTHNQLSSVIVSAPGLTSVGILTSLQVSNLSMTSSSISFVNAIDANGNITLVPKGTGSVDVSSKTIINVASPATSTDAANRAYVDTSTKTASLALSLDTTGLSNTQVASTYLSKVFPNTEHLDTTLCRVVCTDTGTVTIREFALQSGIWTFQFNL